MQSISVGDSLPGKGCQPQNQHTFVKNQHSCFGIFPICSRFWLSEAISELKMTANSGHREAKHEGYGVNEGWKGELLRIFSEDLTG